MRIKHDSRSIRIDRDRNSECRPFLIQSLQDQGENQYVRWNAAIALGWIGEDAVAAMPVLIQVLQDGGQDIPDPAEMLGPIESVDPVKPVVEMLLKLIPALKNDWEYVRPSAASTRG